MEESERDNRLGDADALAAEDAGEAELAHVGGDLAARREPRPPDQHLLDNYVLVGARRLGWHW